MKITYRTKNSIYGIGIQVVSDVDEDKTYNEVEIFVFDSKKY